jgi:CheY-specific phosphatase CheX
VHLRGGGDMTRQEQDLILRINTALFIQNVRQTLKDMANADFAVAAKVPVSTPPVFENGLTVISHFSGRIQGDFMMATDEITASKIADVYFVEASLAAIVAQRETYSGFMREVMNTCAHQSLEDLEKRFGALTLLPPAWIYGEYHTADYISGIGMISGRCGVILCSLSLNMVSLQILEQLQHERSKQ